MSGSKIVRIFLVANAQFSAVSGMILLFAATRLADVLLVSPAAWATPALRGLGVGLLLFAAGLWLIVKAKHVNMRTVWLIVGLDLTWVVATAAGLVAFVNLLTPTGLIVVIAVAVPVALFATGQAIGALRLQTPASRASVKLVDGAIVASVSRKVDAPASVVWDVMTDHPGYAKVASNIAKVEVIAGDGLGMQRRCYGPKGENWSETCTLYEPGQAYGFLVHTEADDYPYPISELTGTWSVDEHPDSSEFHIEILARPMGNAVTRMLFVAAAKRQFKAVLIDLADAWAARMEREAAC